MSGRARRRQRRVTAQGPVHAADERGTSARRAAAPVEGML